jgi:hypothetical protein
MVPGYMWYMYFLSGVKYHRITSLYSAYNNTYMFEIVTTNINVYY